MYPRPPARKRSLFAVLALVGLLAGCGGGGGGERSTQALEGQRVTGAGYAFTAPEGWQVTRESTTLTVKPPGEGQTLAQVTTLTLRSRYTRSLFPKVTKELDGLTNALAAKSNGKVIGRRTVVVAATRARQYDLAYEKEATGVIDRITFVLRGKKEFYVLCRWPADEGEPAACGLLQTSFVLR